MDYRDRIMQVMKHKKLQSSQFAQLIEIQSSTLSHILNGRNNPSLEIIKKILTHCPEISSDWLISGQNPMLKDSSHSQTRIDFSVADETNSLSTGKVENLTHDNRTEFSSKQIGNATAHLGTPIISPNNENTVHTSVPTLIKDIQERSTIINSVQPPLKRVVRIIIYYNDNTFEEFESK